MYRPDYRRKDYLKVNTPKLWDHKNVPFQDFKASHHFWGTQNTDSTERLDGSISTDSVTRPKSSTPSKVIATVIVIGILFVVSGAIAVAVYFTSLSK